MAQSFSESVINLGHKVSDWFLSHKSRTFQKDEKMENSTTERVKHHMRSRGQPEPEINPHPRGPEACLADVTCHKNKDHVGFMSAEKFSLADLPEEHRTQMVFESIQARIPLTVHLSVGYISKNRPRFYPNSEDPFPYGLAGGHRLHRTGSGAVETMTKCGEGGKWFKTQSCTCQECRESGSPRKTWWEAVIRTAAHVTFDQEEVEDTDVRFFYDAPNSERRVCKGLQCKCTDVEGDRCTFSVIIHDQDIAEILENSWERCEDLSLQCDHECNREDDKRVIVISHPHGLSKQVTVGRYINDELPSTQEPLLYTAGTCPGSSGGLVMWVWWRRYPSILAEWHPHSEAFDDGINKSAYIQY